MNKIIFIIPYFGSWPKWIPAFFLSCKKNESINWLIFTDCTIPNINYPNIKFIKMNLEQYLSLASLKLGFQVNKDKYSQCDLKSAYGVIFEEYTVGYNFWGHCDLDLVWGDIKKFLPMSILQNYDIISSSEKYIAGHFTIWKNVSYINLLFKEVPGYQELLSNKKHYVFDEFYITIFLKIQLLKRNDNNKITFDYALKRDLLSFETNYAQKILEKKIKPLNIYWPKQQLVDRAELDSKPVGWLWKDGKLYDKNKNEKYYLHFIDWKSSMKHIDFEIGEEPLEFKILRRGIWSKKVPIKEVILDLIQPRYKMKLKLFIICGTRNWIIRFRRYVLKLD